MAVKNRVTRPLKKVICFFLRCWYESVKSSDKRPRCPERRILVMACNGIGNTVMSLPLIKEAATQYPQRIDVLVSSRASGDIIAATDLDVNVLAVKRLSLPLLRRLRSNRYADCIISFQTLLLTWHALPLLMGIKNIATHDYSEFVPWFPVLQRVYAKTVTINKRIHDVEQNMCLISNSLSSQSVQYPEIHRHGSSGNVKEAAENESHIRIGIHPGASSHARYKIWPVERFIELAHKIQKNHQAELLFFAGPDEQEILPVLAENGFNVYENSNYSSVIDEINRCSLVICNDSGIMHTADLLRKPIIAIWGGTDPARNGPRGKRAQNVFSSVECRPCMVFTRLRTSCPGEPYACLAGISVDRVYEPIDRFLKTAGENISGI